MAEKVEMLYGQITEEALAKLRGSFGKEYRPERGNEVASKDAIRRYVRGIGDLNPLFRDPEYASRTRYGCIIAPPPFLYCIAALAGMEGLPGVHAFYCGAEWEWFKTIRVNDEIGCVDVPTDLIEKHGRMGGRQFLQVGKVFYANQRDELVAVCKRMTMRVERAAATERGKYAGLKKHPYTQEELQAIDEAYDAEEIRGADPRYWEDVNVGDELKPIVKGPLAQDDMNSFQVALGTLEAHGLRAARVRKHPGWGYRDPETGVIEPMEMVNVGIPDGDYVAAAIGVPVAYDLGFQRTCWAGNLITHWMGDDGFLKKLDTRIQLPNIFGDTQWLKGRVGKKYTESDGHLVDIDFHAENQRGESTTPGHATVLLPSRTRWL